LATKGEKLYEISNSSCLSSARRSPPTSDAYYNPLLNEIVFPAGILQPPAFNLQATDAVNYGAIGVVIGHEISHGFDDEGAQFDAQGRLRNWWTDEDLKRVQERTACVVAQFDSYFIEPGLHHNGRLVLGESIGDLAGAKISFLAYKHSREGKDPEPTIDGSRPSSSSSSRGASSVATRSAPRRHDSWCRAIRTRSGSSA
jgi:putative endopeptidase